MGYIRSELRGALCIAGVGTRRCAESPQTRTLGGARSIYPAPRIQEATRELGFGLACGEPLVSKGRRGSHSKRIILRMFCFWWKAWSFLGGAVIRCLAQVFCCCCRFVVR